MPMNRVQFQPGLSMAQFMDRYGTEEQCRAALYKWRCRLEAGGKTIDAQTHINRFDGQPDSPRQRTDGCRHG